MHKRFPFAVASIEQRLHCVHAAASVGAVSKCCILEPEAVNGNDTIRFFAHRFHRELGEI